MCARGFRRRWLSPGRSAVTGDPLIVFQSEGRHRVPPLCHDLTQDRVGAERCGRLFLPHSLAGLPSGGLGTRQLRRRLPATPGPEGPPRPLVPQQGSWRRRNPGTVVTILNDDGSRDYESRGAGVRVTRAQETRALTSSRSFPDLKSAAHPFIFF